MKDNRITIRIPEKLMALLQEQSHQEEVSMSDIIREALKKMLVGPRNRIPA
jgi:metal-responsive CopG/Arc/MetJ family transcriptional regulator